MNSLADHYVHVSNEVLARNVSKTPAELRVDIDEKHHAVDVNIAPKLFVDGWNAATTDPDTVITEQMAKIDASFTTGNTPELCWRMHISARVSVP